MTTAREANEQLKVIRSVMEKAVIFRALSGETALVGGAVALAVAWASEKRHGWEWASWWLGGLALVIVFYGFQLFRMSGKGQNPLHSKGLRMALRGMLPSLVAGGFLGLVFVRAGNDVAAACMWIIHYGVAMLALREFAPRSMHWLGWAFLIFGLFSLATVANIVEIKPEWLMRVNASRLMAVPFGIFHLIYGGLIVTTSRRGEAAA